MQQDYVSIFEVADLTIRYPVDPETGVVGLEIFPTSHSREVVPRRFRTGGLPHLHPEVYEKSPRAYRIDSLAQIKLTGEMYPGVFAQGHTMRRAPALETYKLLEQRHEQEESGHTAMVTVLGTEAGLKLVHRLSWFEGESTLESVTTFTNGSAVPVTLEMLSSFSLSGITPFHEEDAPGRLKVHRFRSVWSAEGRLETRGVEELHLERSGSGAAIHSERFGQVGTMPVRKWFPFVAVEDTEAGVVWGAQLAWAGSWQMEICRQYDDVSLSGGLADREFGHWMKTLPPGESLASPAATLSCVAGTLDDLCDRLTSAQNRAADTHPQIEQDLPIIFNEWCTSWGHPRHDRLLEIAKRLKDSEVRYLVIDAGWYRGERRGEVHGDWIPSQHYFPQGLEATAIAIRELGLIPGLWFEIETVGAHSHAAVEMREFMLQRDGHPVSVSSRHFWNMDSPCVENFLTERVIGLLRGADFGYLKVDYNETLGLGSEDADGLGEGLRKQVLASYRFFEKLRATLPELVIENCASGGHRLEPSMLGRSAMSSFSDAHEAVEIPIIAAAMHRLMLPRQSQIWAVLRVEDSDRRLAYTLSATFLGRMCLSGDVDKLREEQWEIALAAQRLYRQVAPLIKGGVSRQFSEMAASWRHPQGWQAVVRTSLDGSEALVVIHTFAASPAEVRLPLAGGEWRIAQGFPGDVSSFHIRHGLLSWENPGDFAGCVLHLKRN